MEMRWTRALEANVGKLEELAKFYEDRGFFTAATLIAAAAVEIRDRLHPPHLPLGKTVDARHNN